jgi:hypothetical protein
VSVDEEHRNRVAVAARELGIGIDVHDLPLVRLPGEQSVDLAAHLLAEVTARSRHQRQPDHAVSADDSGARTTLRT